MPFCAAARMAATVVLAHCSAPERVRLIADSGAVGGTHSTGCRERFSMLCSRGRRPRALRLLRPERHEWGTPTGAESCSSVRSMRTVEVLCRSPQALERCLHVRHEVSSAILDAHEVSVRNAVVPGHVAEHLE